MDADSALLDLAAGKVDLRMRFAPGGLAARIERPSSQATSLICVPGIVALLTGDADFAFETV